MQKRKKKTNKKVKNREYREKYEAKHPFRNKWFKARYRAKIRGIHFEITYEEFRDFLMENTSHGVFGRTKECLSIDRKDPRIGYVITNLQILTVSENSIKGCTIPEDEQPDWYLERPKDPCPF